MGIVDWRKGLGQLTGGRVRDSWLEEGVVTVKQEEGVGTVNWM